MNNGTLIITKSSVSGNHDECCSRGAEALLSVIARIVQMALVFAATSLTILRNLSIPLGCACLAVLVYGTVFTIRALQHKTDDQQQGGRACSLTAALSSP